METTIDGWAFSFRYEQGHHMREKRKNNTCAYLIYGSLWAHTYHFISFICVLCTVHSRAIIDKQNINSSCIAHHIFFASAVLLCATISSLQQLEAFLLILWKWIHCNLMCRLFFSFFQHQITSRKKKSAHSFLISSDCDKVFSFSFKRLSLVSCYPLFEVSEWVCVRARFWISIHWIGSEMSFASLRKYRVTTNEMNAPIQNSQTHTNTYVLAR